jgi:Ribosomal protein L7/L12 C-terminal domain
MLKRTLFLAGALAVLSFASTESEYHARLVRLETLMNKVLQRLGIDPDDALRDPYGSSPDPYGNSPAPYGSSPDPYKANTSPFGSPAAGASEQIKALLMRGNKIEAIKVYREQTGLGLKQAKDYVDALERQMRGY